MPGSAYADDKPVCSTEEKCLLLAKQGNARAQFNLGDMYRKGEGVCKDSEKAVNWYRKAAEQGFALAQYTLGEMYRKAEGVSKDNKEAVEWYRKAAHQGLAESQHYLGVMYTSGYGVEPDYKEAYAWYDISAKQGYKKSEGTRTWVAWMLSPEDLKTAKSISREYYKLYVEPFQ